MVCPSPSTCATALKVFDKAKKILRRDKLSASADASGTNDSVVASTDRSPSEESLDLVFQNATSVRVFAGGVSGGKPMCDELLLEIDKRDEIAELRECLSTTHTDFHCMCLGSYAIEVTGPQGVQDVIGLHHGQSIRWHGFSSDARLLDGRRLLQWFAVRGADDPLCEFEEDEERQRNFAERRERVQQAVPDCLKPHEKLLWGMGAMRTAFELPDSTEEVLRVFRGAYPIERDALLVLLAWYGCQRENWYMSYGKEFAARALLEQFPINSIIEALESTQLSEQHLEGAARLFADVPDVREGAATRALLPEALVELLRAHVRRDPIKKNRKRFAAAFPEK